MRAVTLNASTLEVEVIDLPREGGLSIMQEAVGGYIECVSFDGFEMWLNEEGKLIGLPINEVATAIWESHYGATDVIMGNVLFTGEADDEGYSTELSDVALMTIEVLANTLRLSRSAV
jgi:hypothetical protein